MPRYTFGDYVVDTDTIEVIGPDGARTVEPQVFDVLRYLVEQGDRLVTKEELLDNVWGDRFVSESALTTRIKQARRALDDDGATQWAIKTVRGRGFRFVAEVSVGAPRPGTGLPAPSRLPDELGTATVQPFCGRHEELTQCLAIVRRPPGGGAFGWVWVLGEPGIGKSRLAAEVARVAHESGQVVLLGRNSEDLRVPFQPFIEAIRHALATGIADPSAAPAALTRLLPGADTRTSTAPGPISTSDDESLRFAMFEGVAEWLSAASQEHPLVVVIDDVHWAADSTLQLLTHLQGRPSGASVTFLLTARDTAPDEHPKVAGLLASAQGREATAVLRLEGLSADDAAHLVGADTDLDTVMRQTAGNPLFLQAVNPLDGTVDVDDAVRRRLLTLDGHVQDALRLGAVLGLEFELRVAAAAIDRDELDLLDDLELAVAARLLDDIGADRFRFAHALVRNSLRDQIGSARRARLHGRIASAYHDVFGDDVEHLPELAYHTAEAAAVERSLAPLAVERLERAAHESSARFSFEEATELLRRARSLVPDGDVHLRARMTLQQGIAEARAGRNMTAASTFEQAIDLARGTVDTELRVESALRYEDATWRPGLSGATALQQIAEATSVLDAAVASGADLDDEPGLRSRLAVAKLRALAMSGRRGEVDDAFADALRLAAELGSPDVEALVLGVYVSHVMFYEDVAAAAPLVERMATLGPAIDDTDIALHALHDRILYATLTGRFDERRDLVRSMAELQERSHSSFWRLIRTNQEAMEAFYHGDLAAAETLALRCLDLADRLPDEDGSGVFGLRMFLIRREQDRLAAMSPLVRNVLANAGGSALWTPGLALLLVETGALDEAASVLEPVKAAAFDVPVDALWSTVMVLLVETVAQLGDQKSAAVLSERVRPLAGTNVTTGSGLVCFGRAERYLGMLSLVLGELDEAERQLGAALEGDAEGGSVLWVNESRLWLSRVRRAQGHLAEADAMAEVVRAEAGPAGLARLVRLASADLT